MKKFLFTLAALLMAGSAFAVPGDNYAWIADYELSAEELGSNNVRLNVQCHFDNYVSAWQVNFYYPEGVTCRGFVKGADLTLTYYDELGEQLELTPALNKNAANDRCIVASTEAAYDADGNYMGAAQWAPGDYADMWRIVLVIPADFTGGDIRMVSGMSSSGWGDNSNVPAPNVTVEKICHLTVAGAQQPEELTANITIGEADGLFVPITVADVNDADAEITVTVGGVAATIENGGVMLPEWNTDYEIVVTVTAKGEGYTGTVTKTETRNAGEQPKTADPEINVVAEYGQLTVTAVGDGEVHLYIDRAEVANPYVTTYDIYEGYGPVTFRATAQEPGKAMGETTKVVEIEAQEIPTVQTPVITYTYDNNTETGVGTVTVTATCATTGATIHGAIDGVAVAFPYTETYDIYEGYNAEATAYATYENWNQSATATAPIVVEAVQYETPAPTVNVNEGEDAWTFTATGEGNVVLYVTTYTEEGTPVTNQYTNPAEVVIPRTDADQVVSYYAVATNTEYEDALPGMSQSATVVIPAKQGQVDPTERCLAPNTAYALTGYELCTVTITNREEGATVYYVVTCDGEPYTSGSFTGESYSFNVQGDGDYVVTAVATLPGKLDSADGGVFFTIYEDDAPTAIDELVNGKQIAGVRYFNMAGQEMQEANGMTIVVTTYTDGTTSAVKVMK